MKRLSKETIVKVQGIALGVAMVMLVVAAAFPILGVWEEGMLLMRYVFAAGAALTFAVRATEVYEGENLRVKRLHRLEKMSSLLYCVSAFLLFYYGNRLGGTDWVGFLLAGAVIQIYTSYMIQYEEKKDADHLPKK